MADTFDKIGHEAELNARDWPAFPMRRQSGAEHEGMTWQRPTQQDATVEILHSNERPTLSAVFGTTLPPSGLSGMLRRFAFQFSESNGAHWVTLILADRLNVIEGLIADLIRGHVPNIPAEMGIRSEIKHNPKGVVLKAGVATIVVVGATAYVLFARSRRR